MQKIYAEIDKSDIKAKKQAEMSGITKGQFLANVSHEIRTPMNGILGFLQLLEKTSLTSEQSMLVNNMKLSSLLLNNVMNDILDMSKMENGEIILEAIPFNLYAAVEDAVVMLTPSAYNQKTTVDLLIGSDTPEYVVGDPTRLKQIISNLLCNAIKFTEQGWVNIEVSLEETLKSVFKVMFKIKDNGIGITRDAVDHLFEPFRQEDNSTTRKYGGVGLGLAITKKLVEAMRGTISVESEEGKGSVFSFTVLLMIDQNRENQEKADFSILNGRSILIADEISDDANTVRNYLEAEGVEITTVQSGAQAILELMKSPHTCDAVLVSRELSDMKADDLLAALSVISATKDIPLILMTSKISLEIENEKSDYSFKAKINKPLRKNQLLSTLSTIIKGKEDGHQKIEYEVAGISNTISGVNNQLMGQAQEESTQINMGKSSHDGVENAEKRQRVLIVDDSKMNTKILELALSENYHTQIANSGKEALIVANSTNPPDLILLDIMMPEMNGYEVCKRLHQEQKTKNIPVIFVTALSEADNEEYGLKLGAIDYITKPFSIPIVKAKIKNHLALKYYQDILKINTDVDQLTQIANRRRFDEMLDIETGKAKRHGSFLTVLLIDIDHFKLYNDAYGHLEGDECLRQVAFALNISLKRPGDLVARWGGEEFTCLLPHTDATAALEIGEKLRTVIMDLKIPHKTSPVEKVVTVSMGVVTSNPLDNISYDKLLNQADEALYQAKALGRNRIMGFQA